MAGPKHARKWRRRFVRFVLAFLLIGIVTLVALQTAPVKSLVGRQISNAATQAAPWPVRVEAVGGFLPFAPTVNRVVLGARDDPWLELRDVSIHIGALQLLTGRVFFENISVSELLVHNAPPESVKEPPPENKDTFPPIPAMPRWLVVDAFRVDRIQVDESLMGMPVALQFEAAYRPHAPDPLQLTVAGLDETVVGADASLRWSDEVVQLRLQANDQTLTPHLTEMAGAFSLDVSLEGPWSGANLEVDVRRDAGTVASLAATIAYLDPVRVDGRGFVNLPKEIRSESIEEYLGDHVTFAFDLSASRDGRLNVARTSLDMKYAAAAAAGTVSLRDQTLNLGVDATYKDLDRFTNTSDESTHVPFALKTQLQGTLDDIAIEINGRLADEDWLAGNARLGLAGGTSATGELAAQAIDTELTGPLAVPFGEDAGVRFDVSFRDDRFEIKDSDVSFGGASLYVDGFADLDGNVAAFESTLDIPSMDRFSAPDRTPLAGAVTMRMTASGDANGSSAKAELSVRDLATASLRAPQGDLTLAATGGPLFEEVMEQIQVSASGRFPGLEIDQSLASDLTIEADVLVEDNERMDVRSLVVTDQNLRLTANGDIDFADVSADFDASLIVNEIQRYAELAGLPYQGRLEFAATAKSADDQDTILAKANGKLTKLAGLPDVATGIVGDELTFECDGRYDGETVWLDGFQTTADYLSASGSASYGLENREVAGSLAAVLPNLAPLAESLERPFAGSGALDATVSGTTDAVSLSGQLTADGLVADIVAADQARISFDATGSSSAIEARFNGTLDKDGETLALNGAIGRNESTIRVSSMNAQAGRNNLSGEGSMDWESKRAGGSLNIALQDIGFLKAWFDLPLDGALNADATLDEDSGALQGELTAKGLVLPGLTVGEARSRFEVSDLFDAPAGTVNALVNDLRVAELEVASLVLDANGPSEAVAFDLRANGAYEQALSFDIETSGNASYAPVRVDIANFIATVNEEEINAQRPAAFSYSEGTGNLSPLELNIAGGSVVFAGLYSTEEVDVRASWTDIPLRLIDLMGGEPLQGATSGKLAIAGSPSAPAVDLTLDLSDVYPAPVPPPDETPRLDFALVGEVRDGEAIANTDITLADSTAFKAEMQFPMEFSLSPFAFRLREEAPIAGRLSGRAELASLPKFLVLDDHVLEGRLEADLRLSGSANEPDLAGFVAVSDAYYESFQTGTILNELGFRLDAGDDTIRLSRFNANDSAGGTMSGSGQISLQPESGFPFALTFTMDDPRLIYRDDLKVQSSGELAISGDTTGALVEGAVTLGPAYYAIPKRAPDREVATVAFREKGAELEDEATDEKQDYRIDLDVACNLPGRVFVRGPGLDSEWIGDLRVANHTAAPALSGTLTVKEGTLKFLGSEFDLKESIISFDGQTPPSPYLRFLGLTDTGEIVARVRVEGDHQNLTLALESEPPLPQDEILAQILFGESLSEVTPAQALKLARYAPLFREKVSATALFGSDNAKPYIVDRFEVRSGAETGDASVAAGKYLGDDFYIEYEQGLDSQKSGVSLEWLFAPHWTLRGKTGSNSEGGAGIFFKRDY